MEYVITKNPNLGMFRSALESVVLVFVFYAHLVYFVVDWYTYLSYFGMLQQEESGNAAIM
jgi:hypothetical protein